MTKLVAELAKQIVEKAGGNGNGNGSATPAAAQPTQEVTQNEEPIKIPVPPAPELKKEMTLMERILKVENLQLVIEKRGKLVQTRSELERFQTASNDFNCSMRLNDSDGNVFTTSFTPGIKKVIEFLKASFDASIAETEQKIIF